MGNFETWLNESFEEDRVTLAKWAKQQAEQKFRIPVNEFVMEIDKFIAAFGIKQFDNLKKHGLLKFQDEGKNRWVRFNFKANKVPSDNFECKNCGIVGKASSPRCTTCGATGRDRFFSHHSPEDDPFKI